MDNFLLVQSAKIKLTRKEKIKKCIKYFLKNLNEITTSNGNII